MTLNGKKYLSTIEVMAKLGKSRRTLQNWNINGVLKFKKYGGRNVYLESDVNLMLE
tara:strand:+ start:1987 stop:2154 length:168 start_codon:yes stop_codon:yes gene_type:complete